MEWVDVLAQECEAATSNAAPLTWALEPSNHFEGVHGLE
jgi:hypothetical protein